MIGQTLGSHQVLAKLGEGGMGEVYLAHDVRLDRRVALKALPDHLTTDPDRLARFEREARMMASLNHPNVGAIYGIEEVGDRRYLVLEFVAGETLAQRLTRGAIPLREAIPLARQIAQGLEAAHQKGVIHRDLKPGNIMIAGEDEAKVLDFGLARAADPESGLPVDSPTVTSPALVHSPTIAGVILGTAGYMSPEQARGKPVDKRSDVFSFGCVLYEMLTGAGPFGGETVTDSLGAILHREPDWSRLPSGTPALMRMLLARCLAKDRRERLQDIGDARLLLDEVLAARPEASAATNAPSGRRSNRYVWPAVAATAALVAAWSLMRPTPSPAVQTIRSQIDLPQGFILSARDTSLALSPDGAVLAVTGGPEGSPTQLWVRPLDSRMLQPLVGTDGAHIPFWSPDGREIAFFADGSLKRIAAGGGTVTRIAPAPDPRGGTWGADNVIVFSPEPYGPLMRVAAGGGTPTAVTTVEAGRTEASHRWPQFLPDGRTLLYYDAGHGIRRVDLTAARSTDVLQVPSLGVFAAPDRLLFVRDGDLMAQPFNPSSGAVGGDASLIAANVAFDVLRGAGKLTTSTNGTLVYLEGENPTSRLEWFDRNGRSLGQIGDPNQYHSPRLSPDGSKLSAGLRRPDGKIELWVFDTARGLGSKIDESVLVPYAAWSPDGTQLAYVASTSDGRVLRVRNIDGRGGDTNSAVNHWAWVDDWSRDGRYLVVAEQRPQTSYDLILTTPTADAVQKARLLRESPADEITARVSRDGRWAAYASRQAGASQIEVIPTFRVGPPLPVVKVPGNATIEAWLDDGSIVYVVAGRRFSVGVKFPSEDAAPVVGVPMPLAGGAAVPAADCGIARDGQRALCIVEAGDRSGPNSSLTLLQNWRAR